MIQLYCILGIECAHVVFHSFNFFIYSWLRTQAFGTTKAHKAVECSGDFLRGTSNLKSCLTFIAVFFFVFGDKFDSTRV